MEIIYQYIIYNPIYIGLGTWNRRTSKNNSCKALLSSVEERYILFSTIETLKVKTSSKVDVKLSIEYKDIPIPVIQ